MAKILVVEDRAPERELLAGLLRHFQYEVIEAADGVEALQLVKAESPDLVISDVLLPRQDGYDLVREIRADPFIARTPVIFHTAVFNEREARELAHECGVTCVLAKPVDPETMLEIVADVLRACGAREPASPSGQFERKHKQLLTQKLVRQSRELRSSEDRYGRLAEMVEARVEERTRELRAAKEEAEAANRAKDEFLSNMSHELRTPLSGVLGLTDLALMGTLPDEARDCLLMARQSARTLLKIVNNIAELSNIQAGRIELCPAAFGIRRFLEGTLTPLSIKALEKGVDFNFSVGHEVPEEVHGDAGRLKQVLTNIVSNAIKFTEKGKVTVDVEMDDGMEGCSPGGSPLCLRFTVADTGVGIPRDKLARIFDSFRTGGPADAQNGGAGLGLAIVKQLVGLMGGTISVRSTPGNGSRFMFTAVFSPDGEPQTDEEPQGNRLGQKAALIPLKVLLADDNPLNHFVVGELLKIRGHEVTTANNGQEALDALTGKDFDVVFMDARMPGMSGEEATRLIRRGTTRNPSVPIVAFTAHALPGDRERFLGAGMDDYLTKPIDIDALDQVLEKIMRQKGPN